MSGVRPWIINLFLVTLTLCALAVTGAAVLRLTAPRPIAPEVGRYEQVNIDGLDGTVILDTATGTVYEHTQGPNGRFYELTWPLEGVPSRHYRGIEEFSIGRIIAPSETGEE